MRDSSVLKRRLALAGAALALTAATIGILKPVREFYAALVTGSVTAMKVENYTATAGEMIRQQRLEEARDFLEDARTLSPGDQDLKVQEFFVRTWLEFSEAQNFGESYNPGKHDALLPLIAEGYRLAAVGRNDSELSAIYAHISLLHYFDPMGLQDDKIERLLNDALALDDRNSLAWLCRGFLLKRSDRLEPAIEAWRKSVELDPDAGLAWIALAEQYQVREAFPEQLHALRKAHAAARVALGPDWTYRARAAIADQIAELLLEDLHSLKWGSSTLGLEPAERQSLVEQFGREDWRVRARAHAAKGEYEQAAAVAWRRLEQSEPRLWKWEELGALSLLFEVTPHIDEESSRRDDLDRAWSEVSEVLQIEAVPLPGGAGPMWVTYGETYAARLGPQSGLMRAGLRIGDEVVGIGGKPVETSGDLARLMGGNSSSPLPVMIKRSYKPRVLLLQQVQD
jgi:tetratricopeptide (TPR) repeat protein